MPKVTVVLTSFNHAKYLREAIESVLNQTFNDFELIIWDDASTDDSWGIIQSFTDSRIKSFRNHKQMRGVYGINKAISEVATGQYIAIHHSDDIWKLEKLSIQVKFLDANLNIGAVFTDAFIIDEVGRPFIDKCHPYCKIFEQPSRTRFEWLRYFFLYGNALCHPSVLIRKECYAVCGTYRLGFAQLGDFDMWVRLCLKYEISVLSEKLIRFRIRDNEANTSGDSPQARARISFEHFLILHNYLLIEQTSELILLFPESKKWINNNKFTVHYALAMAMLELQPFPFVAQFSLQVLFNILNKNSFLDSSSFTGHDFIKICNEFDPFAMLERERLNQKIVSLCSEVAESNAQLDKIINSRSWRITSPLRAAGDVCRGARNKVSGFFRQFVRNA